MCKETNEEFYNRLFEQYDNEDFTYHYVNRDGVKAFAFWDGVSYHNSFTRPDNNGHRKLTVVCMACLYDECEDVREAMRELQFNSNLYSLKRGAFPCGCSKQRGKTLMQCHGIDDFIGKAKVTPLGGVVTVKECKGGKGNKRKYILECSLCCLDTELWPYGSLTSTKANFELGDKHSCGCTKQVRYSESQMKVKVNRICKDKNLTFKGWAEGYYQCSNSTRLILHCNIHGTSDNTKVTKFIGLEGGCRGCASQGGYAKYIDRLEETDYLYLLKGDGNGEEFYKIGRSFYPQRRLKQHEQHSVYSFKIISLVEDIHDNIYDLEIHVLQETTPLWYKPDILWAGGNLECRDVSLINNPHIKEIFGL